MTRFSRLLIVLLIAELILGTVAVWFKRSEVLPPLPDFAKLDDRAAAQLTELRQRAKIGSAADWRRYAEGCLGSGYYVAAEQCFSRAAVLDPSDVQSLYGRAFCLERVGRTTEAIEAFKQVIRRADSDLAMTCWYQIGRCFLREEKPVEAEDAFREIPQSTPAVYQLAKLMIRSDRAAEAVPLIENQLQVYPNSLKLLQLRMHAAEAMNETELFHRLRDREQRAEYVLVLEYGQSFISRFAVRHGVSAILAQAMEMKATGTLAQRQAALGEALQIIREHQFWNYRSVFLAAAYVELGLRNFDKVRELIAEIRRYSQDGVDVLELEGQVLAEEGRLQEANRVWQRALQMKPSADLHQLMAQANRDDPDVANFHQERELYMVSVDAFRTKRLDVALAGLLQCVEMQPDHVQAWYYLGETHKALGEFDKARIAYAECTQLDPWYLRASRAMERMTNSTFSAPSSAP